LGFDCPETALAPVGGGHLFDDFQLGVVSRSELRDVAIEESVETGGKAARFRPLAQNGERAGNLLGTALDGFLQHADPAVPPGGDVDLGQEPIPLSKVVRADVVVAGKCTLRGVTRAFFERGLRFGLTLPGPHLSSIIAASRRTANTGYDL